MVVPTLGQGLPLAHTMLVRAEAIVTYCTRVVVKQRLSVVQAYLKHCLQYVVKHCREDLDFFAQQNDKSLVQRLQVTTPYSTSTQ